MTSRDSRPLSATAGNGPTPTAGTAADRPGQEREDQVRVPVTFGRLARQALHRCGGPSGLAAASAPPATFVTANALGGLTPAFVVLGVTTAAVFGLRILRRESTRAAIGGLAIATLYALTAALSGQARGFFIVPTILPAVLGVACLVTVVARRPVTGLLLNRVAGGPAAWPRHRRLRGVYSRSTVAAALINAANFVVQAVLYLEDRPTALAVAHVAVWPIFATLVTATLIGASRAIADTADTAPATETSRRAPHRGLPDCGTRSGGGAAATDTDEGGVHPADDIDGIDEPHHRTTLQVVRFLA